jgi:hypothetical protein
MIKRSVALSLLVLASSVQQVQASDSSSFRSIFAAGLGAAAVGTAWFVTGNKASDKSAAAASTRGLSPERAVAASVRGEFDAEERESRDDSPYSFMEKVDVMTEHRHSFRSPEEKLDEACKYLEIIDRLSDKISEKYSGKKLDESKELQKKLLGKFKTQKFQSELQQRISSAKK